MGSSSRLCSMTARTFGRVLAQEGIVFSTRSPYGHFCHGIRRNMRIPLFQAAVTTSSEHSSFLFPGMHRAFSATSGDSKEAVAPRVRTNHHPQRNDRTRGQNKYNDNDRWVQKKIQEATIMAKELLRTYALGSLTLRDYTISKDIFDLFKNYHVTQVESVNVALELLERLVAEMAHSNDADAQSKWLCQPWYYNPLINNWKQAALSGGPGNVLSPREMASMIHRMSSTYSKFQPDCVLFGMIMQVVIKQSDRCQAAYAAERLFEAMRKEASETENSDIKPHVYIYNQVINAWAFSGLPEAPEKVEALIQMMQDEGVGQNVVTYNTLLRFWRSRGRADHVEWVLDRMKREGFRPSASILNNAVYCFAKDEQMEKAEKYFHEMMEGQFAEKDNYASYVAKSALHILMAYRRIVSEATGNSHETRARAASRAEEFVGMVWQTRILDGQSFDRLLGTLADVYASLNELEKVRNILQRIETPDNTMYSILIKALGNQGQADLGTEILHQVLEEARIAPNVQLFNQVIDAWAKSKRSDSVDQARKVIMLMEEDSQCCQLNIQPDVVTFNCLLKCIVSSTSKTAGKFVDNVLEEMIQRDIRPDSIFFTTAIKACLVANDLGHAEKLMDQMEKFEAQPDLRTYNEIMDYWAEQRSAAAAEKTEKILRHLFHLAESRPELKPDIYCYNIIVKAWSLSNAPDASNRIWAIFEEMDSDGISQNLVSFHSMINFFCKSSFPQDLERADRLLSFMEKSGNRNVTLGLGHYSFLVMKGWISVGEAARAADVFNRRLDAYIKNKNVGAKPGPNDFHLITGAWINAGNLAQAYAFLEKMQELHDSKLLPRPPKVCTIYMLRNACRQSTGEDQNQYLSQLEDMILRRGNP